MVYREAVISGCVHIVWQWLQDCLAYLLKLMSQFSVMQSDFDAGAHDDVFDLLDSPVKKMRKNKPPVEKFVVPRLNKVPVTRL